MTRPRRAGSDPPAAGPILARRLNATPLIVIGPNFGHLPLAPATSIAPWLGGRDGWTLVVVHWSLESDTMRQQVVAGYRDHAAAYPRHRVTVLCNTQRECELLEREGVPAALCNHNIFVDDRVFRIEPAEPKVFDAVYNARLLPYKRHHLCRDIPRLALIYGDLEVCDPEYVAALEATIPHAVHVNALMAHAGHARPVHARATDLVNRLLAGRGYTRLSPTTVAAYCNRARVGLCLSAEEGAMYASMEYLLCGLPVVNTPNRGGRDVFLDPDFSITVEPDPAAVRDAVATLIERAIPPEPVRTAALERLGPARASFTAFLAAVFRAAGVDADVGPRARSLFTGRRWRWYGPEELVGGADDGDDHDR